MKSWIGGTALCLAIGGGLIYNANHVESSYNEFIAQRGVENAAVIQLDGVDHARGSLGRAEKELKRYTYKSGKTTHTHYPEPRDALVEIVDSRIQTHRAKAAGVDLGGRGKQLSSVEYDVLEKNGSREHDDYTAARQDIAGVRQELDAISSQLQTHVAPEIVEKYHDMSFEKNASEVGGIITLAAGGTSAAVLIFLGILIGVDNYTHRRY